MDDYTPAVDGQGGLNIVGITALIIIDDLLGDFIPDLEPESVNLAATVYLAVGSGQHETIIGPGRGQKKQPRKREADK